MNGNTSPEMDRNTRLWLLVAITVILVGWALHATASIVVPVIFSVFLALIVAPLDRRVQDRVPAKFEWLGHVAAMGAILLCLLIFLGLFWVAAQQVVQRFPMPGSGASLVQSERESLLPLFGGESTGSNAPATENAGGSNQATSGAGATDPASTSEAQPSGQGSLSDQINGLWSGAIGSFAQKLTSWASGFAAQILSAAGAMLGATALIFFMTLIMLIETPKWREKITCVLNPSNQEATLESVSTIADRMRRYVIARTFLGVMTGVLYVGWLWIFGVDLLIVWGLLAFLLNYIPTFGSLIVGILAVGYTFVLKDVGTALGIGVGILVIEQVMGNYVDPRIQGRQVAVSSLVVMISLLAWIWIWGVAGALLAVPVTVAAMIICAHIGALRSFALMLSNAHDFDDLDRQAGLTAP